MISILPVDINDIPCVPVEVFQERIRNAIEEKTGKKLTLEEFRILDVRLVGQLIGINKMRVVIVKRLWSKVVCPTMTYDKAVISGLLMKEN